MKEIYIINLNKQRIFLLIGVFLVILGTTLWLGLKIGSTQLNGLPNRNKFSAITEDMGISHQEIKNLNLSPTVDTLENMKYSTVSPVQENQENQENKKIPSILTQPTLQDNSSKIDVKNYDPLEKSLEATIQNKNKNKNKKFSIQVAAFNKKKDATTLVNRMKTDGFLEARVERGTRYYYVRTGYAKNKKMLTTQNQKIKNLLNVQSLIIQTNR